MVEVKMKIDQQSPSFGEKNKGDKFAMNADLAKIMEDRGILEIVTKKGKK